MGVYDPSVTIDHLSGDAYQIDTEVEVNSEESIKLESDSVSEHTRYIIYDVQRTGGGEGEHPESGSVEIDRQPDEEQVTVEIKKGGVVKGTKTVNYT